MVEVATATPRVHQEIETLQANVDAIGNVIADVETAFASVINQQATCNPTAVPECGIEQDACTVANAIIGVSSRVGVLRERLRDLVQRCEV